MTKLIKNWKELSEVEDSETHTLDIDVDYEWITKKLQQCGFVIKLDNWDK